MKATLDDYIGTSGLDAVEQLRELATPLADKTVVHVNSTRIGGGVAEILTRLVPLTDELGNPNGIPILAGEDCAERLWSVNASVLGEDALVGESRIARRSISSRSRFSSAGRSLSGEGAEKKKSAGSSVSDSLMMTARSRVCLSSRTLPGQW